MEAILGIIVVGVGYYIVISIIGAGARAVGRGVKKVVTGKDTYFGPPQLKFVDEKLEGTDIVFKKIMFRGNISAPRTMNAASSISAFDATNGDDDLDFLISLVDQAQEPDTVCFGMMNNIGQVNEGDAFTDWVQLGAIAPDLVQGPKSGNRTIKVVIRLFNANNPPSIRAGFSDGGETFLVKTLEFDHFFKEKGYEEAAQDREEAQALSLKIGVAVAMADGSLDDAEGEILKNWIVREVSAYGEEKQKRLKKMFNESLKEGFAQAQSGNLALSPLVDRLAEIGEKKTKYDAVELCFDVMAADGVADPEEMVVIRKVADALGLDMDEIEKMRESVTLNLSTSLTSEEGLESLVGIEEGWSDDQKKKHIRTEFQKWSNRLNSLPEGDERDAAQNMLDNLSALKKKYD
jgi:tellurite resistance protein